MSDFDGHESDVDEPQGAAPPDGGGPAARGETAGPEDPAGIHGEIVRRADDGRNVHPLRCAYCGDDSAPETPPYQPPQTLKCSACQSTASVFTFLHAGRTVRELLEIEPDDGDAFEIGWIHQIAVVYLVGDIHTGPRLGIGTLDLADQTAKLFGQDKERVPRAFDTLGSLGFTIYHLEPRHTKVDGAEL